MALRQTLGKPDFRGPPLSEEEVELPTGFRVQEMAGQISDSQMKILKQDAHDRLEAFEVLSLRDVSNLSKVIVVFPRPTGCLADHVQELDLLNERCTYLRRAYISLRHGRNGLHARMLRYLRTPQTSKGFRESLVKQVEALAELDLSIDDWVARLEQAESRRNRIQQKLVEHYAATSTLPTVSTAPPPSPPPSTGVHTPAQPGEVGGSLQQATAGRSVHPGLRGFGRGGAALRHRTGDRLGGYAPLRHMNRSPSIGSVWEGWPR